MSLYQILIILITVVLISAGQILFKLAANDMTFSFDHLLVDFMNLKLFYALMIYAAATIMWLVVLKLTPLKIAYPFMGMAYIFVPVFSRVFLGETIHWQTIIGAIIICCGIWVATSIQ